MNIALIGYGKMGKEIAAMAKEQGHSIVLTIDVDNQDEFTAENLQKADVAIDFTAPAVAAENIIKCLKSGTPIVSGTTGWLDQWTEIEALCTETSGSLFYASNFSIGVNIMFALNRKLASMMKAFPDYEVKMKEIHHTQKLDAPSGTAITLANQIINEIPQKDDWHLADEQNKGNESLSIEALREGDVFGYHRVTYGSNIDSITIEHNAKSRKGFVSGALMAASYIIGKKGIHTMEDMLNF